MANQGAAYGFEGRYKAGVQLPRPGERRSGGLGLAEALEDQAHLVVRRRVAVEGRRGAPEGVQGAGEVG
jgi:hypothetical protein